MNRAASPGILALLTLSAISLAARPQLPPHPTSISFTDQRIQLLGRTATSPDATVRLAFPGSGFIFHFRGSSAALNVSADSSTSALTVVVDDGPPTLHLLKNGENHIPLIPGDTLSGPHTVRVFKRTETWQGIVRLENLQLPSEETILDPTPLPQRKLLFVGDSVTCGANIIRNDRCAANPAVPANDAYNAFGMILGRRLDAQATLVCYGGRGVIRDWRGLTKADGILNAPEFLDSAIPADDPKQRTTWNAQTWQPNAIIVALGTNDFNLQPTKPLDENQFVAAYTALLQRLLGEYPAAQILATEGPIVTNPLLRRYIQRAVEEVKSSRVSYALSNHYPGDRCDGHPTLDQQRQIADDLESSIRAKLDW